MRRRILPFLFLLLSVPASHAWADVGEPTTAWTGAWTGTLIGPGNVFDMVVRIRAGSGGEWEGRLDIPVRGLFDSVVRVDMAGDSVHVELSRGAAFRGVRTAADTVVGAWSQQGLTLPLLLVRRTLDAERRRPQDPHGPLPYGQREVRVRSVDGVVLAGTLTLPPGAGPHPAAVLIGGSGPQDRQGTFVGHRPLAVLADHLTRRGIAVLRYDERGVGASSGVFETATTLDLAADVRAAATFLAVQPSIDEARVGLIGHSEGGMVAPLAALDSTLRTPAFMVLLAAPGLPLRDIAIAQAGTMTRAEGAPEAWIRQHVARVAAITALYHDDFDATALEAGIRRILEQALADSPFAAEHDRVRIDAALANYLSPWARFAFRYDPVPALRAARMPVLALNGLRDTQIDGLANLAAIQRALHDGGNTRVDVAALPGLNHYFQTAVTGAPGEYGLIDETFAPAALARISDWILAIIGTGAAN